MAAVALLIGALGCSGDPPPPPPTTEDTSFRWTFSDSAMAAGCVLQGPSTGRFDVRYTIVAECIRLARSDMRSVDIDYIATHAVDCGTHSEGQDPGVRLRQIEFCLEDVIRETGP
jgi:hypothetical protein